VILLSPVLVAVWALAAAAQMVSPRRRVKMLMGVVLVATAFGALAYAGTIGGDTGRVLPALAHFRQHPHRRRGDRAEPDGHVASSIACRRPSFAA